MRTDKTSIVKESFKEAKSRFVILSLPLSFYALITVGILALGFFVPLTLIFTIPFIIIPCFFSVSAINSIAPNKNTHEGIGFFIMFRAYFSQLFRGGYRVIFGLLKALLVFLASSAILSAILSATVLSKDAGYLAFMEQIKSITDTNELTNALNNFINSNKTFNIILIITNSVSFFLGSYMFLHHFAVNSIKYNYNFVAKMPLPMQDLNLIFKLVLKKNRKEFYKQYYKAFWFLGLIFALGFAGGVLIPYFFIPNVDMVQLCVIGLFASFILLLFFIPYFLNASQLIFNNYKTAFVDTLIDLSKQSLEEMKKMQAISEDKEKEVLKIIESQKEDQSEEKDKDSKQ